jgi:opacity protein-like surface antigen
MSKKSFQIKGHCAGIAARFCNGSCGGRPQSHSTRRKVMLWRKMALVAIVFYSTAAPYAYAQHSFEVTPFFGSRFGGVIDETTAINPTVSYDHILIKNSFDYGGLFDYALLPNLDAEFMFNRQPTEFTGHDVATNLRVKLADGTLDEYEWGILWAFRSPKAKIKPYIVAGFGFTQFHPPVLLGFSNRFSDSFGGGVKYFLSDHFGLRLEARWSPTATTTGAGFACARVLGQFPCYQTTGPSNAQQGQVNLGFILRFK